jgi:hypothetical protein
MYFDFDLDGEKEEDEDGDSLLPDEEEDPHAWDQTRVNTGTRKASEELVFISPPLAGTNSITNSFHEKR